MLNLIILILLLFIFINKKKEYFNDVKRHDQDKILSTNYQLQNYKIKPIKKQNGWDTYWDKNLKLVLMIIPYLMVQNLNIILKI